LKKYFVSSSISTCYRCKDCDLKLCEECLQVSVLIQTIENMDNHLIKAFFNKESPAFNDIYYKN
jgi:hypothetical protein